MENKRYNLSIFQDVINYQLKYSLHKGISQVPIFLTIKPGFDFDIMKAAIKEEIKRNDSLRISLRKEKKSCYQWFNDDMATELLPDADFSGSTREKQYAYLKKISAKPLKHFKDNTSRFALVKCYDGSCGIMMVVSHFVTDASGMMLMASDLLDVYFAMKNGTPMPKELGKFEVTLQDDIKYGENADAIAADEAFFKEYITKNGKWKYSGIVNKNVRTNDVKLTDSTADMLKIVFHDKSEQLVCNEGPEFTKRLTQFCEDTRTSSMSAFLLALKLYLSTINGMAEDFSLINVFNRRIKLVDKHSGGCRMGSAPMHWIVPHDLTVSDAINQITAESMGVLRHANFPAMKSVEMVKELCGTTQFQPDGAMQLSLVGGGYEAPDGYEMDIEWISGGFNSVSLYLFIFPRLKDGGFSFNYEYRTYLLNRDQMQAMHNGIMRAFELMFEDPTRKLSEILEKM